MIFVTDSYYCDRGFKGIYEQIPCLYEYSTTLAPPVTQTPVLPCNSLISQQYFTLNIFAEHQDTCVFTITKNTTVKYTKTVLFYNKKQSRILYNF